MMNEIVKVMIFFLAGAGIGIFYFGGLWWTLRKLSRSRRPHLLTLSSFLVRSGFCLAGLFWIAREGRWEYMVSSLLGIIGARWVLIRLLSPEREPKKSFSEG